MATANRRLQAHHHDSDQGDALFSRPGRIPLPRGRNVERASWTRPFVAVTGAQPLCEAVRGTNQQPGSVRLTASRPASKVFQLRLAESQTRIGASIVTALLGFLRPAGRSGHPFASRRWVITTR
jgi:hypothetical protein